MRYDARNMIDQDRVKGLTLDGVKIDLTTVEWIDTDQNSVGVFDKEGGRRVLQGKVEVDLKY